MNAAPELPTLIADLMGPGFGYPIASMEELIAAGEPAAWALVEAAREPRELDSLLILITLAQLRHAPGLPFLLGMLRQEDLEASLLDAAAIAAGQLGSVAVAPLCELADSGPDRTRYWALAALGRSACPQAARQLRDRLKTLPQFSGVIALALDRLRSQDMAPALYEAYQALPEGDGALAVIEEVLPRLAGGRPWPQSDPYVDDWRLAWRRRPQFGWQPGPTRERAAYGRRGEAEEPHPKRSWEDILTVRTGPDAELCPRCARRILRPSGIPVCPENAARVALLQEQLIEKFLAERRLFIPEALDDLDAELGDQEWRQLPEERRQAWSARQITLEVLLAKGCRRLQEGLELLRGQREGLGKLWV